MGAKRGLSEHESQDPITQADFDRSFIVRETQVANMNIKLLVRDLADTVRHPCDLSDTVPSDDPLIRLDEDGYKIVALSDFEPSKLASTELLRIRVAAGCGQGGRIWGGVSLLCLYLQEMFGECKEPQAPGWRVLELGAGIGVCGLCAAAISPNLHVTISDGLPLLLSLANKNVDLNAGKFVSIPVTVKSSSMHCC